MGILRLILAISVVLVHSGSFFGFELVSGLVAVQAFYIISGFYMTMILNEKYIGTNNSYKLFISNRFLRLYPIYWIVLLCTILVALVRFFHSGEGILNQYSEYYDFMNFGSFFFLIFTNLCMFFQDIVMFLGLDTTTGNLFFTSNFRETSPALFQFLFIPQAWTIGVELMFYLIAPFLVKRKTKYIVGLIACSFLLRLVLMFGFGLKNDPWTYRFFPTELLFFLVGILAYQIYKQLPRKGIKEKYLKLIWICLLGITIIFCFLPKTTIHSFIVKDWLYLFIFFLSLPFIFSLTKKWKIDRYIGELSYPVYISHMLILSCIGKLKISTNWNSIFVIIFTILFSMLLNKFVAKRIEKVRQGRIK
jgi:peptidoglycan/LPS O-acetylase OafA/YrhL